LGIKKRIFLLPFTWRATPGIRVMCADIPQKINRIKAKMQR